MKDRKGVTEKEGRKREIDRIGTKEKIKRQ